MLVILYSAFGKGIKLKFHGTVFLVATSFVTPNTPDFP